MRIGIDATPAIKQLGGVSEYTKQLVRHLSAIDRENSYQLVTFSLFRSQTTPLPALSKNFQERAVPLPASIIDRMWRRAGIPPLELFTGRVNLLFFPSIFMPYTFSPTIVAIHDLAWLRFPELAPEGEATEFRSCLSRAVRTARHVITISDSTKKDLTEIAHVPAEKITVIGLGYDQSIARRPSAAELTDFRARHSLGDAPFFLHVGTIEPRKNLVRLVRAFSLLKEKTGLPHQLVFIGRFGWKYTEVLQAIEESRSKEAIKMLGTLSDTDRRLAYWAADALVFPSLYEGFGIPILEGQAAQKPVLTGTGGSLKEVGGDSVLSIDVTNEEAIAEGLQRLATDQRLVRDLVKKGSENVKRFSWQKTAQETLSVFREVSQ